MQVVAAIASGNSSADPDGLVFLPLNDYPDREAAVAAVLPLVHDAGNPYFDWFFGSTERASAALAALIPLDSPEVAAHRVKLAVAAGEIVGMYLALPGVRVMRCRKADTIALLKDVGHDAATREVLHSKLVTSHNLFPPVEPNDFYLSKIGVVRGKRRRGLGRAITEEFVAAGRRAGFRRFSLDVSADNEPAVRIYRSLGFDVASEQAAAGMRYFSMRLVEAGGG